MNLLEWIPFHEAAKAFRLPARWVKALVDSRSVDSVRVDGVAFVWLNDLAEFLKNQKQGKPRRTRPAMFFESLLQGQEWK